MSANLKVTHTNTNTPTHNIHTNTPTHKQSTHKQIHQNSLFNPNKQTKNYHEVQSFSSTKIYKGCVMS